MKQRTFVYIAGPYSAAGGGYDASAFLEIDRNISNARTAAAKLAIAGVPFFCPHLNSAHFEVVTPQVTWEYWLDLDLRILNCASAALFLDGWELSRGSCVERDYVQERRIPCFDEPIDDVIKWWQRGTTA